MTQQGEPGHPHESISNAVHQLAAEIHGDIVAGLMSEGDAAEGRQYDEHYPRLLFAELAMNLAGVKLPDNPTAPDRARGIIEALRRITTDPQLFESITNVPYSDELAKPTAVPSAKPGKLTKRERQEARLVRDVQERITEAGYLDRSMVPEGRTVQLQYTVQGQKRRLRADIPAYPLTLKLAPATITWNIRKYRSWTSEEGYQGYLGNRKLERTAFTLVAATSPEEVPPRLRELVGKWVSIGQVAIDSDLRLNHKFRAHTSEVPGYEKAVTFKTYTADAKLQQAYLGDTTEYPLFLNAK